MKKRRPGRSNPSGERFTLFPAGVLTDPDWRLTHPDARAILIDMSLRWQGPSAEFNNNGRIGYGCRAAEAIGISKSSAAEHLADLTAADWLRLRREAGFKDKRLTREYELTFFPTPGQVAARRARSGQGRRVQLLHSIFMSPKYRSLSGPAKVVLVELMRRYNGSNNGRILFGLHHGVHIGLSRDVTRRAIEQLAAAKFIVEHEPAKPGRQGKPRRWRLTMYKADGQRATSDFVAARSGSVDTIVREIEPIRRSSPRDATNTASSVMPVSAGTDRQIALLPSTAEAFRKSVDPIPPSAITGTGRTHIDTILCRRLISSRSLSIERSGSILLDPLLYSSYRLDNKSWRAG